MRKKLKRSTPRDAPPPVTPPTEADLNSDAYRAGREAWDLYKALIAIPRADHADSERSISHRAPGRPISCERLKPSSD